MFFGWSRVRNGIRSLEAIPNGRAAGEAIRLVDSTDEAFWNGNREEKFRISKGTDSSFGQETGYWEGA